MLRRQWDFWFLEHNLLSGRGRLPIVSDEPYLNFWLAGLFAQSFISQYNIRNFLAGRAWPEFT